MAGFDRTIPAGGEGRIGIRLNPKGCTGDTKKSVLILTNDPKNAYFSLVVTGKASMEKAPSDR